MDADKEPLPALPGCPAGGSPAAVARDGAVSAAAADAAAATTNAILS